MLELDIAPSSNIFVSLAYQLANYHTDGRTSDSSAFGFITLPATQSIDKGEELPEN